MKHKQDSFWGKLNDYVEQMGRVSYGDLCTFVAEEGFKIETATRRLRENPSVGKEMSKSKRNTEYISAYYWKPYWNPSNLKITDVHTPEFRKMTEEIKRKLF
jgi:hypothetical protein